MRVLIVVFSFFLSFSNAQDYKFLIGTYTKKTSKGIYYAKYNSKNNKIEIISNSEKIEDPSYVAINKKENLVYAVSEAKGGAAHSYNFNKETGDLKEINFVSSGGVHPCHIILDKTEKWLFLANYSSGSLGLVPVKNNGELSEPVQSIQFVGNGPNAARQEKPHVHFTHITPDNKNLLVADLGTDKLYNYAFDSKAGKLSLFQELSLSPGSGPRHIEFHPSLPFVYVIQELTGSVTQFKISKGKLTFIQEVSALPNNFDGKNSSADIHISPDGKFLYGSNRFYDTIVTFEINKVNGKLSQKKQTSVKGKTPRNFAITNDGKYMFVANQDSDNIVVFSINKNNGELTPTGAELTLSMPVCIKFLKQ